MPIQNTKERQAIVHGLLKRIEYVASHDRSEEELFHLEVILQQTLEKFIKEDTWDDFYTCLNNIATNKC